MSADRFDRIATATSMFAAGPVILAGLFSGVWENDTSTSGMLEAYVGHTTRAQVSAVLLHFGYLLLLPALLGLAMQVRSAPRLRAAGLVLGVLGGATLPGLLVIDFYDMAAASHLPMAEAVTMEDAVASYPGVLVVFLPTILGLVLGFALLGVAAGRARVAPWWSPALLVAGLLVSNVVRGGGLAYAAIGMAITTIGLVDLGRRTLRSAPLPVTGRSAATVAGPAEPVTA